MIYSSELALFQNAVRVGTRFNFQGLSLKLLWKLFSSDLKKNIYLRDFKTNSRKGYVQSCFNQSG